METPRIVTERICPKCGYRWFPRVPNTKKCPRCQVRLAPEASDQNDVVAP